MDTMIQLTSLFLPPDTKRAGQITKNPKGGPLDKNICFQKSSDFTQNKLKKSEIVCWFQKHIDQWVLPWKLIN